MNHQSPCVAHAFIHSQVNESSVDPKKTRFCQFFQYKRPLSFTERTFMARARKKRFLAIDSIQQYLRHKVNRKLPSTKESFFSVARSVSNETHRNSEKKNLKFILVFGRIHSCTDVILMIFRKYFQRVEKRDLSKMKFYSLVNPKTNSQQKAKEIDA